MPVIHASFAGGMGLLLDVVPAAALGCLFISFLRRRSALRREKEALQEKIRLFQEIAQDSCGRDEDESGNQGNT